jgi:hypothetical protein
MDSVIIGGGLTGLLLTHQLHRAGHNVTLLEARDTLGGAFRRPALDFIPATKINLDLSEWLRACAAAPVNFQMADHRPEVFMEASWRSFAGFGETDFQTVSELGPLSHTHEVQIEPSADQIVRALIDQLPITANLQTEVTEIKVSEGLATEVIFNGDKAIKAGQVFFTGQPRLLNNLVHGEGLPAKHRTRLAKMSSWTSVVLELTHPTPLAGNSDVRLFSHNAKEFEPVFGRVTGSISRWATLVSSEREDEHEFTGQCIRHIKRQLKRAWPEALDGPQDEKIYVFTAAYGQNSLKTKAHWLFPEISNLFLGNHTLASQAGFMGRVEAAKGVLDLISGSELTALDEAAGSQA